MNKNTVNQKSGLKKLFLEPDPKQVIKDPEKISKKYHFLQPTIFIAIYLLYFASYLGRKQLAIGFCGPAEAHNLGIEDVFGINHNVYAILGVIYYTAYGIGKFLGGVMADKANVRVALPTSLIVSAVVPLGIIWGCNLFSAGTISQGTMILMMYISWGISAFIQAASFPMCSKILTFWYSNKNRATIWSFWSTSHELGSAASLGLATFLITRFNYQAVFYIPAVIGISVSIVALILLRDKPVTQGLPDVETFAGTIITKTEEDDNEPVDNRSYGQVFKEEILKNKNIWVLSLSFICLYIMRTGPVDWFQRVLQGDPLGTLKTILVPTFGCLGTLSIPWVSEKIFKGRRAPALFIYFLVATVCFTLIYLTASPKGGGNPIIALPEAIATPVQFVLYALLGISTYGPLVMIGGVASIESASKKVASAATGFTGGMGYVGSVLMSIFGGIFAEMGTGYMFAVWIIAGIIAMLLMLVAWNQKANKEYSH
ncbi:MAG: MFS transporter [Oscillospiraceae bacterium]|nr:MFS transporter [Oscillospiraceae bacterium]